MTNDTFYIPITTFVSRYPTPELSDPVKAWNYHIRQWRDDGILQSGVHYTSRMIPPCRKLTTVYHERFILVYIYTHRGGTPFCGLVWKHSQTAINAFLKPDKSS